MLVQDISIFPPRKILGGIGFSTITGWNAKEMRNRRLWVDSFKTDNELGTTASSTFIPFN